MNCENLSESVKTLHWPSSVHPCSPLFHSSVPVSLFHWFPFPSYLDPLVSCILSPTCWGMTSFPLQKCLRVFPIPISDTFGILRTLTTFQFQKHFRVSPILSPFQKFPTLPCVPSTSAPHPIPPPKAAPRPPPLPTLHPPIQALLWCSQDTLGVVAEMKQLPQHLILRVTLLE